MIDRNPKLTYSQLDKHCKKLEGIIEKQNEELLLAREFALNASKIKNSFIANISHEIRTPMNAIIGMTHLMFDTELNKDQHDYMTKIHDASNNLLHIINEILDFSNIESGILEIESTNFDLSITLEKLANEIGSQASRKGIDLLFEYPPELPMSLAGDPVRLEQILRNLANNAVKFTQCGEISLNIEIISKNEKNISLRFSVTDTGIGIDESHLSNLFKEFSQGDSSTTRKYGGTGLGLVICKQLVEMMGGEISVHSEPGTGSTFSFTSKFGLVQHNEPQLKTTLPTNLKNTRVLIVDDCTHAREILERFISSFGMYPVAVPSAKKAIEILRKTDGIEPFELILMDWKMPEMDGIQASKLIKQDKNLSVKPTIILVTGYGLGHALDEFSQAEIDGYLPKPVNPSSLFDSIMSALHISGFQSSNSTYDLQEESTYESLNGAHLLLVEDNDINQQVAEGLLKKVGVSVRIANNGLLAIEALQNELFDGVLMDLQMPIMDGIEATKKIRSDSQFPSDLPIIAMTANAMPRDIEICAQAGMNAHISKPIDPHYLYTTLSEYIHLKSTRKPKSTPAISTRDEKAVSMPTLYGIDSKDGLQRMGSDEILYYKILNKFQISQEGFVDQLRHALSSSDHALATRLAHTLKSVSGNIGAIELHRRASSLESAFNTEDKNLDSRIVDVELELSGVILGIKKWQSEQLVQPLSKTTAIDKKYLILLLERIRKMLEEYDAASSSLADELQGLLEGTSANAAAKRIQAGLNQYDFDASLEALNEVENELVSLDSPCQESHSIITKEIDLKALAPLLKKMRPMLEECDTSSVSILDEIQELLQDTIAEGEMLPIQASVNQFDFNTALKLMDEFTKSIKMKV